MIRRASALVLGALLVLGVVVSPRATAAAGTPGGLAGVSYAVAGAPSGGFASVSYPLTVLDNEDPDASWFWADEVSFAGDGSIAYLGLQPHGQDGQTALFSVFGDGTSGGSTSCSAGADGGSGTSCHIPYAWRVGTTYTFTMALASQDASGETWNGTVTDTGSGQSTMIGTVTVAASRGLITPYLGFAEYYSSVSDCSAIPQMSVRYDAPSAARDGVTYQGTVSDAYGYGSTSGSYVDCSSVAHVSHTSSSGYVAAPEAAATGAGPGTSPPGTSPPAASPPPPPPPPAPLVPVAPVGPPAKGEPVTVAPPGAGAPRIDCQDYRLTLSISVISVPVGSRVLLTGALTFRDNPDAGIPVVLTERYADGKTVPLATVRTDTTGTFRHYHRPRYDGTISAAAGCLRPKPVTSRAQVRVSRPRVTATSVTASISPGTHAAQRGQLVEVGPDGSVLGVLAVATAGRLSRGSNPLRFARHPGRECVAVRALGTKLNAGATSSTVCVG